MIVAVGARLDGADQCGERFDAGKQSGFESDQSVGQLASGSGKSGTLGGDEAEHLPGGSEDAVREGLAVSRGERFRGKIRVGRFRGESEVQFAGAGAELRGAGERFGLDLRGARGVT